MDIATVDRVLTTAGDDFKPARRLPARERTHWNGWGSGADAT